MILGKRLCGKCVSYKVLCKGREISPFTLEFIGFHHMAAGVMEVNLRNLTGSTNLTSYQEFVFRYFLKDSSPDIIIVPPPVNHGKFREIPYHFRLQLRSLKSLIDAWMPRSAQVYWLPGMAEHENRRNVAEFVNRTLRGKLASELILELNRRVYKELEPELLREAGRYFGFFDLFQASINRSEWSFDGTHMQPFWYELIMSYLLQLFCVS